MTWRPEIDELAERQSLAHRLGGEERVARHKTAGKLTVRERIDALVDADSFREIGSVAGFADYDDDGAMADFTPANFVFGRATLDGRPVIVAGDDFTVRGGAADAAIWKKQTYSEAYARELAMPVVRLVDGSGGGGSVKTYLDWGRTYVPPLPGWRDQMELLGEVPVVAAALGSVAGLGAARVAASHFSVMVDGLSQVFVAGPPLVAYAAHEEVTKEELGGARMQTANGVVDNLAESEEDAFFQLRRFLSYLPPSVWEAPPVRESSDRPHRREDQLLSFMPRDRREVYDGRVLIGLIVDRGSFFEIGRRWGRSIIVGLAEFDGHPVGVTATDPGYLGGTLTADASRKLRRFVDLCDTFHLPIVNFVDQPGFEIGPRSEAAATLRHGVEMIAALYQATVPYFSVIVRRVFGVAGAAMVDRNERANMRVAWPSGDWGSLPLEGGVEAAFRRRLDAAEDRDALREELLAEFEPVRSPYRTAEAFDIEEVIDPRDTRPLVCEWVHDAYRVLPQRLGPKARAFRP
ncbi:MAG: carboxyl transferase domain-containing protein [Acidimicrobiia bacterium]